MREKWEYEKLYVRKDGGRIELDFEALTRLGKNGWELVTIYADTAYFKRKIEPAAEEYFEEMDKQIEMLIGEEEC